MAASTSTADATVASTLPVTFNVSTDAMSFQKVVIALSVTFGLALIIAFVVFVLWYRTYRRHNKLAPKSQLSRDNPTVASSVRGAKSHPMDWRAAWVMFIGLIVGLAFAIAHHFIYARLDGRPVVDFQVSQSWWLRIGNGLAFMTKVCFATSVGTALVQMQWFKHRKRSLSLRDLDALSNVLSNILTFLNSQVWLYFPSLTFLAVVCWLLPLVPLLAPGTLNVASAVYLTERSLQVPQLDFTNYTMWLQWDPSQSGSRSAYGAVPLSQLAIAAAVGGQILPFAPITPNATYHLDFIGPAIKCIDGGDSLLQRFHKAFDNASIIYSATVPIDNISIADAAPLMFLDQSSTDYSKIYFMQNPGSGDPSFTPPMSATECGLYNSLYSVDFSFQGSSQVINVSNITYLAGVPFSWVDPNYGNRLNPTYAGIPAINVTGGQIMAYGGLMSLFGSLVLGQMWSLGPTPLPQWTKIQFLSIDVWGSQERFQRSLEEVFMNMTISLFSQSNFQKNSTTADWVKVEAPIAMVAYFYNAQDLLLTYGVAFFLSLCCTLFGFYAFAINGGSYINQFSTFMRATIHSTELRSIVSTDDNAAEPLPLALVGFKVRLSDATSLDQNQYTSFVRDDVEYRLVSSKMDQVHEVVTRL